MTHTIQKALLFARKAHGDQKRRYTNEPYWHHLQNVAAGAAKIGYSDLYICIAWLHDTVEDTDTTLATIRTEFGVEIMNGVELLTDVHHSFGNRASRKVQDRARLAYAPPRIQTLKVLDLLDNTPSIVIHDHEFAKTYLKEKELLLNNLQSADPATRKRGFEMLEKARDYLSRVSA